MNENTKVTSTKLGAKLWTSIVLFGLIGQIAWNIENMYFATFAQNLFQDTGKFGNIYYIATTLMVILSAVTATVTTVFAGGLCDKVGKRKPFVAFGYIIWGVTIMLFATIPLDFGADKAAGVIAMLVVFDCVMTFFGSTANDAAFNTWLTDNTDVTNRGLVNAVLSILPVFAMVLTMGIAMFTFDKGAEDPSMYRLFFIIIGIIPVVVGILAVFTMKDSDNIIKNQNPGYLKETFYGFRPEVIRENKMLYVTLTAACLLGIAQQIFMSYLINFITKTLGITDYLMPLAVVIVGVAVIAGVAGVLFDKFGRKNFYIPLLAIVVAGMLLIYFMKFIPSSAYLALLIVGGMLLLGSTMALSAGLSSTFQDYIPKGYEGRFQGVRMTFQVLIPMIIGPIISLIIGINSFDPKDEVATTAPPFEIFLAGAVVAVLAFIPIFFVRKDANRLRESLIAAKETNEEIAVEPAE